MHLLQTNLFVIVLILICRWSIQADLKPYNGIRGLYEKPATWTPKRNLFPSSLEEMRPLLGVKKLNGAKLFRSNIRRVKVSSPVKLPESFDAREHWSKCQTIRSIVNQGHCGSCWAVAAATTLSDRFCIASNGSTSVKLSANQLTTCCFRCGYGCGGGFPELAWEYIYRRGLVTGGIYRSKEGCQPYNVKIDQECHANECTNPSYDVPFEKDLHKTTYPVVLEPDEESIMAEIYQNGPVEACLEIFSDFYSYGKGVYKRTELATFEGGHAVRIIGWGVENGLKYWLCANSWGRYWGENGTFRIMKGQCQIEDRIVVAYPIV